MTYFQHNETRMQQKAGLKLAEEAIQYRPTSAGQYRQPTSYKQVRFEYPNDYELTLKVV